MSFNNHKIYDKKWFKQGDKISPTVKNPYLVSLAYSNFTIAFSYVSNSNNHDFININVSASTMNEVKDDYDFHKPHKIEYKQFTYPTDVVDVSITNDENVMIKFNSRHRKLDDNEIGQAFKYHQLDQQNKGIYNEQESLSIKKLVGIKEPTIGQEQSRIKKAILDSKEDIPTDIASKITSFSSLYKSINRVKNNNENIVPNNTQTNMNYQ